MSCNAVRIKSKFVTLHYKHRTHCTSPQKLFPLYILSSCYPRNTLACIRYPTTKEQHQYLLQRYLSKALKVSPSTTCKKDFELLRVYALNFGSLVPNWYIWILDNYVDRCLLQDVINYKNARHFLQSIINQHYKFV